MMEVARVMGQRLKTGWRPRRTIMFLSWGAEEYSLCGSREFVEEYEIEMSERWAMVMGLLVQVLGTCLISEEWPTLTPMSACPDPSWSQWPRPP